MKEKQRGANQGEVGDESWQFTNTDAVHRHLFPKTILTSAQKKKADMGRLGMSGYSWCWRMHAHAKEKG